MEAAPRPRSGFGLRPRRLGCLGPRRPHGLAASRSVRLCAIRPSVHPQQRRLAPPPGNWVGGPERTEGGRRTLVGALVTVGGARPAFCGRSSWV